MRFRWLGGMSFRLCESCRLRPALMRVDWNDAEGFLICFDCYPA